MLQRPVVEIAPRTWLMSEYKLVNMYLVEGETGALLIDCGSGIGDIPAEVRKLTDKPVTLVATHGHMDHTGAAAQFEAIYMHPVDIPGDEKGYENAPKFREFYVRSRVPARNPGADEKEILALIQENGTVTRISMEEGHIFDLGGRTLEVIHTPGHTDGSCCLLDRKARLLFTGDACNDRLLLIGDDREANLRKALATFEKMWAYRDEFDYICQGHDVLEKSDKSFISDYIEAITALLNGAEGAPRTDALHSGTMYPHNKVMVWYNLNMGNRGQDKK